MDASFQSRVEQLATEFASEATTNEQSAVKLVYMAIAEASKKWTRPIHHWKQGLNHFAIMYEDRMPTDLS